MHPSRSVDLPWLRAPRPGRGGGPDGRAPQTARKSPASPLARGRGHSRPRRTIRRGPRWRRKHDPTHAR
eukprot:3675938-Lingulodinium_polyedra.AAC.1